MAVTDFDAFLADVLSAVPADRKESIEGALRDPSVAGKLREGVSRQSEFSRAMDGLRTERENLAHEKEQWEGWYADASREHADSQAKLKKYQDTFGDLEEGARREPVHAGITEEQLAVQLQARDKLAIQFADLLTDLKIEHRSTYNEKLDTTKLIDFCAKKGLPLDVGYDAFTAEARAAKTKESFDKQIKQAREDGAREYATSHKLPVDTAPREAHPLDLAATVKTDPRERVAAAVAAFNNRDSSGAR